MKFTSQYFRTVLTLGLLFSLFLIQCREEKIEPREYTRLRTLSVEKSDSIGITVHAEIFKLGSSPVTSYGFVWGRFGNITLANGDKAIVGTDGQIGTFSYTIRTGIEKNKEYSVRAFAQNESHTSYGDAILFTGEGSLLHEIEDFSPKFAQVTDTVVIKGKNFSTNGLVLRVRFGNKGSTIVSATQEEITCLVPGDLPNEPVSIEIEFDGKTVQSADRFVHIAPEVTGLSSTTGTFGDIIEVYGRNFHEKTFFNEVFFDEGKARLLEGTQEMLRVEIPATINKAPSKVRVNIQNIAGTSSAEFTLIPPTITNISATEGVFGDRFFIEGNYFSPEPELNKVLLGGAEMKVLSSTGTRLEVEILDGIFSSRKNPVFVDVATQIAQSSQEFTLKSPWIKRGFIPVPQGYIGRTNSISFSIHDEMYLGLGYAVAERNTRVIQDLWKSDIEESNWTQMSPFPHEFAANARVWVLDNKAFVAGGQNTFGTRGDREVFVYDPTLNKWNSRAILPENRYNFLGDVFTAGNKAYLVYGELSNTYEYEYDPIVDTWTVDTIPNSQAFGWRLRPGLAFSYNGKGYLINAEYKPNELWEYDPLSNQLVQQTSFPVSHANLHTAFLIKDKLYVLLSSSTQFPNGATYQYEIGQDTWTRLTNLDSPNLAGPAIFTTDDAAYFLGGRNFTQVNRESNLLWEFRPSP